MAEPISRRDRLRAATVQEIKQAARRALVEQGTGGLSLRGVARDLGLTAPALYRYFPSREVLLEHLIADIYDEACAEMTAAADTLPADDLGGRLLTASRTFRRWALAHPPEFALLFGSPIDGVSRAPGADAPEPDGAAPRTVTEGPVHEAGQRFGAIFAGLVAGLYVARPFPVPADDEIETPLREQLEAWCDRLPVPLPLGVMQVFLSCWIRLYGSVCMEAFGHLRFAVQDAEPIFEAELRSLADLLGHPDAYRRP
ncbi:MAG TPA: TetR/AcrR family transcriptional regulator [Mycobacteriales bacterium]|nr:TetR/AcrR family transcriptional regulator [Mycobacteriales bacterium]